MNNFFFIGPGLTILKLLDHDSKHFKVWIQISLKIVITALLILVGNSIFQYFLFIFRLIIMKVLCFFMFFMRNLRCKINFFLWFFSFWTCSKVLWTENWCSGVSVVQPRDRGMEYALFHVGSSLTGTLGIYYPFKW